MGRSLPVMSAKGAGQNACKLPVRPNANGWASLCNYPMVRGEQREAVL